MMKKVVALLLAVVFLAGATGYLYIGQLEQVNTDEANQLKIRVQKASNALSLEVKSWQKSVEKLSKDRGLLSSLQQGEVAVSTWVDENQPLVKDMLLLRVIRPGLMRIDITLSPPLGYAGLDLLRRVESSKKVEMPEVHMMGGDDRHIAIVAPVFDSDKTVALVLASFNVEAMRQVFKLATSGEKGGWLMLKQGSLLIAKNGEKTHKNGSYLGAINVIGTRWKIVSKKQFVAVPVSQGEVVTYTISLFLAILLFAGVMNVVGSQGVRHKFRDAIKKIIKKKTTETTETTETTVVEDVVDDNILSSEELAQVIKKTVGNAKPRSDEAVSPIFLKGDEIEVNTQQDVPRSIFRAYDIRGIVDETLTEQGVFLIGRAIASTAINAGQRLIVIARDGRLHSQKLSDSLAKGIQATGCDVVDIGEVPTPVLYFATHHLETQSGVMITGSHNPANYNGLKIVIAGETLFGDAIQALYQRIEESDFGDGEGLYQEQMLLPEYIGTISNDVRLGRMMKIVVDCGNGVAGASAPMLLSTLGCEVVPLYCEVDGNFPNHHPDPSKPENLQELIEKVQEEDAELGLAFDGDGDRLGVVDSGGNIIWPDRQMMLYAMDVLSRQTGADIIYDVKCSRNLAKVIAKHGGKPIMSKTGHSLIKAKMKETNAELAGEMSGHIFFKERWYGFDDALYTASRLLEIVTAEFRPTAEIFADLPDSISTPELSISMQEGENFTFVGQLRANAEFEDAKIITIDGVRVEFEDGWGLVRASNTTPSLVLRFEADDELALDRIKDTFREQMLKINADLELPF